MKYGKKWKEAVTLALGEIGISPEIEKGNPSLCNIKKVFTGKHLIVNFH